jgi:hypothetical protein
MSVAINAPHLGVVAKERKWQPSDASTFMGLVARDKIVEAINFGETSADEKTNRMAEMLKTGGFVRPKDNLRIPPQAGYGSMPYFWHLHAMEGPYKAYDWLRTVKNLRWFLIAWDEGRAHRKDGSRLAPLVHKKSTFERTAGPPPEAKAKKAKRSQDDREMRERMKGK